MTSISSVPGTAADLASRGVRYAPEIARAASRHGVDARLLAAVAAQETGGPGSNAGRNVVGDGGHGHGVFQIDDRYHAFARGPQAMEPQANADYAAQMISGLLAQYGGNVRSALSAYNAGSASAQGTVTQWGDGARLGYADSVMRHYADLGGTACSPAPPGPQFESLLEMLQAESASEQANVGALSSFAMAPSSGQAPSSHSYRSMDAQHVSPAAIFGDDDDS